MPCIKNMKSDFSRQFAYKCYILNVRSHRDYVCLEIDNCPSALDISSKEEFSIDSSQVVMPVLDQIRFNIKSADNSIPKWFERKLQVFAEGKLIFPSPDNQCSKCNCLFSDESTDASDDIINKFSSESSHQALRLTISNCNMESDENVNDVESKSIITDYNSAFDDDDDSPENLLNGRLQSLNELRSKSEMLTIHPENSNDEIVMSQSFPEILLRKQFFEKSVQTCVSLGNKNHSYELLDRINEIGLSSHKLSQEISKSINISSISLCEIGSKIKSPSTINIPKSLSQNKMFQCNSFQIGDKIRYWSLINSARQMMKINSDIMDLNSVLKSLNIEKSSQNNNLITSLSPVNLLLKLKKLNRSSSCLYGFVNNSKNNNAGIKETIRRKWSYLKSNISSKNSLILSNIDIINEELDRKRENEEQSNMLKTSGENNSSTHSMETLFVMQKQMMKMMEIFLRNSENNQVDDFTSKNKLD